MRHFVDNGDLSRCHDGSIKQIMKRFIIALTTLLLCVSAMAADKESRYFEMRTYYAAPGKLDALQARFRNHTFKLFEKHGIENIGYWVPLTNTESKLIYILAYPNVEARDKSWRAFAADPVWQAAVKESESNGRLVAKGESIFLQPTDFSPVVKTQATGDARLFELRTYRAAPGKLDALLARFRDHTVKLFAKHGMTQLGYWVPTREKDGAGQTLIYILAHKNQEASANSFKGFRADPDWLKARSASEVNGPLTVKDGVQSLLMTPTDFSPTK